MVSWHEEAERPQQCPTCRVYHYGPTHTCVPYDAGQPCATPGCEAPTAAVAIAAPGTGSGRTCLAGHYHGTCRELRAEEVR